MKRRNFITKFNIARVILKNAFFWSKLTKFDAQNRSILLKIRLILVGEKSAHF